MIKKHRTTYEIKKQEEETDKFISGKKAMYLLDS